MGMSIQKVANPWLKNNGKAMFEKTHAILWILLDCFLTFCAIPLFILQELHSILFIRLLSRPDPKKLRKLQGKVVLITGATSGIGECLAKYFYLAGARVILAARRINELERVREELLEKGNSRNRKLFPPFILQIDMSKREIFPKIVENLLNEFGTIDILVNNAGLLSIGSILKTKMEVEEELMKVNYFGPLYLTKLLGNEIILKRGLPCHFVFNSSLLGKTSMSNYGAYAASKHAIQALADVLQLEKDLDLEGEDKGMGELMKVTIISPGIVKTPLPVNALVGNGGKFGKKMKEFEEGMDLDWVCQTMFNCVVNEDADVLFAQLVYHAAIFCRNFWPRFYFFAARLYSKWCLSFE